MKKKIFLLLLTLNVIVYGEEFDESKKIIYLEDTVISTTGFYEKTQSIAGNITIITSEEIKEKNFKSLTEVFENTTGVSIINNVFGGMLDMRGQGDKAKRNVQFFIDGVNMNPLDVNHGIIPLGSVNIESIDRIEIIPGGGAVLYGGGTEGGIINIITKNIDRNSIDIEAGSFGMTNYKLNLNKEVNKNFFLGINYNKEESNGYREYSEYEKYFFNFTGTYKSNENRELIYKYSNYSDFSNIPPYLTEEQIENDRTRSYTIKEEIPILENKRIDNTFIYNDLIKDGVKINIITNFSEIDTNIDSKNKALYANANNANFKENKYLIKPKINYDYKNGSVVLGYDYINGEATRGFYYTAPFVMRTNKYDMSKISQSIFVQNKYNINKFQIDTGLRHETADYNIKRYDHLDNMTYDYDKKSNADAYNIGINYIYSDSGKIYGKIEKGYILPAPNEFISKSLTTGYYINNISPENFVTYEFGFEDYIKSSNLKGAIFYTKTEDEIASVVDNSRTSWSYYNIDNTVKKGMELSLSQNIGNFMITPSFSYIDAKVVEGTYKGKRIPGVSKNTFNLDLMYYYEDSFNVGFDMIYRDKYYADSENKSGLINSKLIANLKGNYSFSDNSRISFGINNVFNSKYSNSVIYSDQLYYDPAPERNYSVGFKHIF